MLEFYAEQHKYTWREKHVESVTQAMVSAGMETRFYKNAEAASKFGTEFHALVKYFETGVDVEYDTVLDPYLDQWMKFVAFQNEQGWYVLKSWIERPMYSEKYGYAGTPDVPFQHEDGKHFKYVDVKTGALSYVWDVQCCGYCQLMSEMPVFCEARNIDRMCVQIMADKWVPIVFDKRLHSMAFNIFISALNIARWKRQKGI